MILPTGNTCKSSQRRAAPPP